MRDARNIKTQKEPVKRSHRLEGLRRDRIGASNNSTEKPAFRSGKRQQRRRGGFLASDCFALVGLFAGRRGADDQLACAGPLWSTCRRLPWRLELHPTTPPDLIGAVVYAGRLILTMPLRTGRYRMR